MSLYSVHFITLQSSIGENMNIILLGAPGSGKGTEGKLLSTALNIPTISTGDIIRENVKNQTELGKMSEKIMAEGKLVPDELVISLVKDRLQKPDCKNGYILDGFPRTVYQAEQLSTFQNINAAILIDVDVDVIESRIVNRRTCSKCGKIYSKLTYKADVCECGGQLTQRADDNSETVRKRYAVYEEQTKPLIDYYQKQGILSSVKGEGSPEDVHVNVMKLLGNLEAK